MPDKTLRTTLELRAQQAADAALVGVKEATALVALRISSGSVIAVSVGPDRAATTSRSEASTRPARPSRS